MGGLQQVRQDMDRVQLFLGQRQLFLRIVVDINSATNLLGAVFRSMSHL